MHINQMIDDVVKEYYEDNYKDIDYVYKSNGEIDLDRTIINEWRRIKGSVLDICELTYGDTIERSISTEDKILHAIAHHLISYEIGIH